MVKMVSWEMREYFALTINNVTHNHVALPLRGRFKGENREGCHIVAISAKIDSSLSICSWVEKCLCLKERRGSTQGYYFIGKAIKGRKCLS